MGFPIIENLAGVSFQCWLDKKYTPKSILKAQSYKDIENLTVASDTHVCKATHKLGLITDNEFNSSNVQQIVIDKWQQLLKNTKYKPIDIHTPLWLWSPNGFKEIR